MRPRRRAPIHSAASSRDMQPRALEVGVEDAVPIRLVMLEQRLGDGDAGIVDEDVDRPELRLGRVDRAAHARVIGHVAGNRRRLRRPLPRSPPPPRRAAPRAAPAARPARRPAPAPGEMPAEPARRAGDDRGVGQGEVVTRHPPPCPSPSRGEEFARAHPPPLRGRVGVGGSRAQTLPRARLVAQHEFLDLAGRGLGQRAEHHRPRRLVMRHVLAAEGDDRRRPSAVAPGFKRDEGAGALAPCRVGPRDHRRLHHRRMAVEHLLDLERRDVLAAGDDDVLGAVLDLDIAVRDA